MLYRIVAMAMVAQVMAHTFCEKGTGGTCKLTGCKSSRGPTDCESGSCVCKEDYCASVGTCYAQKICEKNTGGTCSLLACKSWREAECVAGKCKCKEGGCVLGNTGTCSYACEKNTGGTCSLLGCKSSRGPTDCESGQCVCKKGYCASVGVCYPCTGHLDMMFTNTTALPVSWLDDEQIGEMSDPFPPAFIAAFTLIAVAFFIVVRRRRNLHSELAEELLATQNSES
eukprot:gnl/MRDRNA2_/MRDRNA2_78711_c0_seq1.p1 gnl/MRDRNA2_/MRDRNA2_78711_c0~~gnl/MRDRNA2_/MRDRNA2_78711_c0_seq1.p1  ORF type:complete len:227 (+),score=24.27 gnl/MRDRNA2_/MRDRNA2_78711_c0_seq1:55-735(+)